MRSGELFRFYRIIKVFFSYGLDELVPVGRYRLLMRLGRLCLFWIPRKYYDQPLAARLRLALEKLGPVWVKFGQMLSTRRDLFSAQMADELALLQDSVPPFDGIEAKHQIESALGGSIATWFEAFDPIPLASASVSQVHTATLVREQGVIKKSVVIKVIRPDILPVITADMKLMRRLASWTKILFPNLRRLRPLEVVEAYEKNLMEELNLLHEAANAIQLRRNFEESSLLYIPEIYADLCRENVLVMERIYGIPVSDVDTLKRQGINMELLAERGVQVFFTQVFRDSFFHADMHPGNVFVSYEHPESPQYIAIDFGLVGSLNKEDKRYLAENFIAFFNRDYRRVAELHVDSGWVPIDTCVEDFESAIRAVSEPIFEKPLSEISFGHLLFNLFSTARRFNMEVQPQLVLLQKTLLYVEGLGRQLYPKLDLWKTAKPFLENWIKRQTGLFAAMRAIRKNAPFWAERLPELPDLLYDSLNQHRLLRHRLDELTKLLAEGQIRRHRSNYFFCIGMVFFLSSVFSLLYQGKSTILSVLCLLSGLVMWWIGHRKAT